jgi:hypothetical protein
MSDSNASDSGRGLNHGGISAEEADWLAAGGADAGNLVDTGLPHWPALWMALGFLGFQTLGSLRSFTALALYYSVPSASIMVYWLMFAIISCAGVAWIWGVASGRLNGLSDALARRYALRARLLRDLTVVMAVLVLGPIFMRAYAINNIYHKGLLDALPIAMGADLPNAAYQFIRWSVCIWILAYLLPRKQRRMDLSTVAPEFDLDTAVARWRERLLAGEGVGEDDALELEEHLREDVAALTREGLSEAQSFALACRRLGDHEDLSREFAKAQPDVVWRARAQWMLTGILALLCFGIVREALARVPLLIFPEIMQLSATLYYFMYNAGMWLCAAYLFTLYVDGRLDRWSAWVARRHTGARMLATDLALLTAICWSVEALRIIEKMHPVNATSWSDTLVVLVKEALVGLPQMLLICAGIYWLRPAAPPQGDGKKIA